MVVEGSWAMCSDVHFFNTAVPTFFSVIVGWSIDDASVHYLYHPVGSHCAHIYAAVQVFWCWFSSLYLHLAGQTLFSDTDVDFCWMKSMRNCKLYFSSSVNPQTVQVQCKLSSVTWVLIARWGPTLPWEPHLTPSSSFKSSSSWLILCSAFILFCEVRIHLKQASVLHF